jgi:hypothetical protein
MDIGKRRLEILLSDGRAREPTRALKAAEKVTAGVRPLQLAELFSTTKAGAPHLPAFLRGDVGNFTTFSVLRQESGATPEG